MVQLRLFACICVVLIPASIFGQIPNPDFENWTSGEPDGWVSSNTPLGTVITQSTTAHHGSYSVQGTVVATPVPGINLAGTIQSGAGGKGFPISQSYTGLTGWYQLTSVGGDLFAIDVVFKPVTAGDTGTAVGAARIGSTTGWTQFNITMTYYLPGPPDSAVINFSINGPTTGMDVHVGSMMLVDDISFTTTNDVAVNGVPIPATYALEQNYPNPFNPSTTIQYQIPTSGYARMAVSDLLGREVAVLVDGYQLAGYHRVDFSAGNLASGMYVYTLTSGGWSESRKLMLLR